MTAVHSARARVASLIRHGAPQDSPAVLEARRDLRFEVLIQYVKRMVEQDPPLTEEQLNRVEAVLYQDE